MTDQENNFNLGKIVSDDNNQWRKLWSCLEKTWFISLFVFLSELFVIFLIIFGCFWKIHLSKTSDASIVWVGTLCSAAGYILPSPSLRTSQFLQTIASLYRSSIRPRKEVATYLPVARI